MKVIEKQKVVSIKKGEASGVRELNEFVNNYANGKIGDAILIYEDNDDELLH